MIEFIIRSENDDDFGLHASRWQQALTPAGFHCEILPGFSKDHLGMLIEGKSVWFSPEDTFWQVSVEADDEEWADRVAQAVCQSLSSASGLAGRVVPI